MVSDHSLIAGDEKEVKRLSIEIQRTAGDAIRRGNTNENSVHLKQAVSCLAEVGSALCRWRPLAHKGK